ncbi:LacI family DNA-binding transcriptional regulator [Amphibacillus sp. Q70]|uniref:LacI family DNA-binding transcriptional regulator n=1 Tax=Amphibacillus sp. Q70 TaxID=3453416 RepID=UPI003F8508CA
MRVGMQMVTINDIAKRAGVAKSTVSRYLNNGSVSSNTREKIDRIVAETGYKPNVFARSLKAQKTNMLGVIIPRLNSPSTSEVLVGIDRTARKQGYQLIMTNSDQDTLREIENIYTLNKQKVEGIMMLSRKLTDEHLQAIEQVEVPFLLLGQKAEGVHSIIHADYDAGRKMGEYALDLGHRTFLYVGVSLQDEAVGVLRKKGFIDAVQSKEGVMVETVETSFSRKDAYQKALIFLKELSASFVVCATDNLAVAVLKAAHELGYTIPKDFSLSGFGGYEDTSYVTPSITTVRYPYSLLGEKAVLHLKELIAGKETSNEVKLANELVENDSTLPLRF